MKELVGIEPVNKNICRVEIGLCNICNFNCPYCVEKHMMNTFDKFLDYESLKNFFNKLSVKEHVEVNLAGGEPTLHPKFLDLVRFLKSKNYTTEVLSNGSRKKEWWKKAAKYLDVVHISFHPTETTVENLINNLEEICEDTILNILILCEPKTFNFANKAFDEFRNRLQKNTYLMLKPIVSISGSTNYTTSFTKEELKKLRLSSPPSRTLHQKSGMLIKKYSDGTSERAHPNEFVGRKSVFTGWKCWIGVDTLRIWQDGNIYRGYCEIHAQNTLGSIFNLEKFEPPKEPIICSSEVCNCKPEIKVKKEKYYE